MNVVEEIYARNPDRPPVPYRRKREPVSLAKRLSERKDKGIIGIIAEFKRKSPSGFTNHRDDGPAPYFKKIGNERIAAFSILTEPSYFNGNYDDITAVQGFGIPILDKDFISSQAMIRNAYNAGADAILLILDFLRQETVYELSDYAISIGLESLIEFHEISLAKYIRPAEGRIFGYNRRNLRTLKMEPEEEKVLEVLSETGIEVVLESGIDAQYLKTRDVSEYAGLLIGTSILNGESLI